MRIIFRILLTTLPSYSIGQNSKADSIFYDFEKCLSSYFKGEFKRIDTSYLFLYGNKLNPFCELVSIDLGSGRHFASTYENAIDSSHVNDSIHTAFFYRGMSFAEFIDYIISQRSKNSNGCILRKEKGVKVFVDCTDEAWQHFYFDKLVYQNEWSISPVVDVFKSDGTTLHHSRYILLCSYRASEGFKVSKKYVIRKENEICGATSAQ